MYDLAMHINNVIKPDQSYSKLQVKVAYAFSLQRHTNINSKPLILTFDFTDAIFTRILKVSCSSDESKGFHGSFKKY